jgi:hypothetical protein
MRTLRYLAAVLVLGGCGAPGLVWRQADINGDVVGVLNVGNTRLPVQQRCGTPRFMSPVTAPVCAYAFVDSNGRRVDIFDLRDRIDAIAETLPQLHPWINKVGDRKDEKLFPFRMYLLTVSPAIVLIVPRPQSERYEPCGFLLRTGCIQSQSFRGNSYWFRGNPSIHEGAFWFNADERGPLVLVPSTQEAVLVASGGASVRLVPSNGQWTVSRDK